MLKWSGRDTSYEEYFKQYWIGQLGSETSFNNVLQDGIKDSALPVAAGNYSNASLASAAQSIATAPAVTGTELVLYQKSSIGTGTGATNPWLQELPDGVTKACWGNYALISMSMAKELVGIDLVNGTEKEINNYEYYPQKPVIKITMGGQAIELPILAIPGMQPNTIAVALGYGRSEKLGRTSAGVGQNAYGFTSSTGNGISYHATVTLANANRKEKVAQSQIHNTYEDRVEVVRETTLATLLKHPNVIPDYRNHLEEAFGTSMDGKTKDFRKEGTLYPMHDQPGIKWGMNIDMNACFGCGACVVACHAENNVPVVGKSEVLRYHDMHWLRIDRYFVSDENNPDELKGVVFQPMMCQHCDNAPCENVCPVAATNHSSEGINQMTYNRCIGTRYCANNCPFKVRRFNWADYTGADSFPNNRDQQIVGKLDPVVEQMNDDLILIHMCGLPGYTPLELIEMYYEDGYVTVSDPQSLTKPRSMNRSEITSLLVSLDLLKSLRSDAIADEIEELKIKLRKSLSFENPYVVVSDSKNSEIVEKLEQAIAKGNALKIVYLSGSKDESTERLILPLEIYQANSYTYLSA